MTARDAAVRAVAEVMHREAGQGSPPPSHHCTAAELVLAALATSADVRAGLVALTEAAVSHPHGDLVLPAVWRATAEWNIDAVLAALGGAADACTHESATGVDQDFGPDKVWACDGCGWRYRTVVADGLARDVGA